MCFLVIVTFIWAYIAVVDEVTQAEARVIPSGKEQVINSLEGGLLSELLVAEGDLVQKNQPLAKLDSTRFASQYKETVARKIALKAAKARASAEAFGTKLKFPNDVMENNDASILVHGHTHIPGRHRVDDSGKERIVLGEWNSYGSVLSLCEASWTLSEITL